MYPYNEVLSWLVSCLTGESMCLFVGNLMQTNREKRLLTVWIKKKRQCQHPYYICV
ncbi:hypothetical protein GKZ87_06945 [Erysipelotrichaceae bacterium 66202529]|nr:hypothetical protein GKZ87_06945 [Erysipelotrichaceae bacterium 66202529]